MEQISGYSIPLSTFNIEMVVFHSRSSSLEAFVFINGILRIRYALHGLHANGCGPLPSVLLCRSFFAPLFLKMWLLNSGLGAFWIVLKHSGGHQFPLV